MGAWAIPTFAPKLLTQDEVDPTKTNIVTSTVILGVVDVSLDTIKVLTHVADLTRRTNGEAIILYVYNHYQESNFDKINLLNAKFLADIPYQLLTVTDNISEEIINIANKRQATTIIFAKNDTELWRNNPLNSVSQQLLNNSKLSITLI